MRTQRLLGRAQVRHGRISRKAKRGIVREGDRIRLASSQTLASSVTVTKTGAVVHSDYVRNSQGDLIARVRNRITQEGVDAAVRQSIGCNRMTERHGGLGEVECQYVGPRSQLTVRLLDGGSSYNRKCLRQTAERKKFGYRSVYGPQCWEDDVLNVVVIRLYNECDEELVRVLRAGGWRQRDTDRRKFTLPATRQTRLYAADFCHMHAGDWFTLSGVKATVVEMLRHGTSWSYPLTQATIAVAGSGTTKHMKAAHPYRKPKSRSKSDGLTAAEVAASRINGNSVRYIPRLYLAGKSYKASANTMRNLGGFIYGEGFDRTGRMGEPAAVSSESFQHNCDRINGLCRKHGVS